MEEATPPDPSPGPNGGARQPKNPRQLCQAFYNVHVHVHEYSRHSERKTKQHNTRPETTFSKEPVHEHEHVHVHVALVSGNMHSPSSIHCTRHKRGQSLGSYNDCTCTFLCLLFLAVVVHEAARSEARRLEGDSGTGDCLLHGLRGRGMSACGRAKWKYIYYTCTCIYVQVYVHIHVHVHARAWKIICIAH